ncbi:hypothetical protein PsorP6_012033 [Peronosclerospora sorghi]|uniref:Uncharacterized protein n=1 Tax=Peronosclerospora sorghi TaxID=230839 RepID=A0ACC0WH80_9STRA|nr:hypothetical protein PsorP6_012033 [Peronosclerospora sorghi]
MAVHDVVPNSVGWYILEGYPWWPVYICDVFKLRPDLHLLGSGHKKILKKARDFPSDFTVVYYFGSHDFSLVGLKKGVLRPWECAQKDQFLKGHPKHLTKKKGVMDELVEAIQEAEEYLSQPEDIRLPQHMVPSDLDPTLEPPPAELAPPGRSVDVEMDDHEMDMDGSEAMNGDEDNESDVEKMKRKKKKISGDKKKEKKKPAKEKKETSRKPEDKKRKKSREKSNERKHLSPVKVAKTSLEATIKSEVRNVGDETESSPPPDMSTEALSIILEKEIRWILVNCPFEEMTTKTVRKLLEKRLKMDLRHHKASIKEGVARVIASMEEEDAVDAGDAAFPASEESAAGAKDATKSDVKREVHEVPVCVTPDAVMEKEVSATTGESPGGGNEKTWESTEIKLEAASKSLSLALELEPKIMDVLNSLKFVENVNKDVLAVSPLRARLIKLRAHSSSKICELVSFLAQKWDAEDLIPAPKPITKEEILALKAKLENSETSHDELLVCLNELGGMALTIDHLKKTKIARVVSKLRQHGNDKVSAKAHELRQHWIKQTNEQPTDDRGSNQLQTLKTLYTILAQQSDGTDEQKLQSKQLAALEQLHSMSLDTKDIIDSKVGIPVSKLRKSR